MNTRPTRRVVLSAGAFGLAAACTSPRRPGAVRPARPDPDIALTAAAVDRERALLAAYDAALAATPALAGRLAPLRAEHAEHLAGLGAGPSPGLGAGLSPGTPTASPATAAAPPRGPGGGAGQARSSLATAEHAAAAAHAAATVTASARLAAVLASLAASEASHQVALG